MRRSRFAAVSTSLAAAIALSCSAGGGGAAVAAGGTPAQLSIRQSPDRGIYHDEIGPRAADVVEHTGRLTTTDGSPVADATVTLERRLSGETGWTALEDDTTDAQGRYTFRSDIAGNASYHVVSGQDGLEPSASGEVLLEAMRDFNAVLVEKDHRAVLKGNLNPGWDRKIVRWQKKRCKGCSWRTVDKARSGDHGSWRFSGQYPRLGDTWYYRARIKGTDDFVASVSAMLITTRVAGRQVHASR